LKNKKGDDIRPRKNQCRGIRKDGKPCGAAPTAGGLCFFHANPAKASELGREGGRKNRRVVEETRDPLRDLKTARDVQEMNQWVIEAVCAGKIEPQTANSVVRALTLQLGVIRITDFEHRLAELEKKRSREAADATPSRTDAVSDQTRGPSNDQTNPSS
jgi:hypothetical protein